MTNFYVRSRPTANWVTGHVYSLGDKVVGTSTTAFLGILFEVTTGGTSSGTEPAWNATVGGTTTDSGGVVWTTRGGAGLWQASKNYALGDRVCKTNLNTRSQASTPVWKCTTAGASGVTEPTWPTTITSGTTTQTDGTVTWTAQACTSWDDAHPYMRGLVFDQSTNVTTRLQAGDSVYVSHQHAETWAPAGVFVFYDFAGGSVANPIKVICAVDTGQPQPPTATATTATVSLTGSNQCWLIITGAVYMYGIAWNNNTTGSGTAHTGLLLNSVSSGIALCFRAESCSFKLCNSSQANFVFLNNGGSVTPTSVELINCTLTFSNAASAMQFGTGRFRMKGGSLAGTVPTGGIITTNSGAVNAGSLEFDGVDLSLLAANNILQSTFANGGKFDILFRNCKLGASFTFGTGPNGWAMSVADFINCDNGGTNYKLHREYGQGTIDHETTKIRSGGASDGVTGISHKMISSSSALWQYPLPDYEFATWNDNSGSSKTATVEILADTLTNLNNDDIWLELEYLGASGNPQASTVNTTKSSILAANAALTSSAASWTTTGMTHPNAMKLQATFTPQQKGPVVGRVYLGKASQTVYVDPVITIT